MEKYTVEVTVNHPKGEDDLTFINATFEMIESVIQDQFPKMTSFMLICVPLKK